MGGGHHLPADLERLLLPRLHPRLLQPRDRRLALATSLRTELVLDALEMANGLRRPEAGLIAHSDRGSQYTSLAYTDRLDELGIAPSVGSRGDAYDNAMAEAWVATFKSELVDGRRFRTFEHVEHEVLRWIGFYNEERLHEELGDVLPTEYEEIDSLCLVTN